jgi:hypothetical protein
MKFVSYPIHHPRKTVPQILTSLGSSADKDRLAERKNVWLKVSHLWVCTLLKHNPSNLNCCLFFEEEGSNHCVTR